LREVEKLKNIENLARRQLDVLREGYQTLKNEDLHKFDLPDLSKDHIRPLWGGFMNNKTIVYAMVSGNSISLFDLKKIKRKEFPKSEIDGGIYRRLKMIGQNLLAAVY
jgi:hypothetical protein